jgi:hypothetical protein
MAIWVIIVAAVASWVFGAIYYNILAKPWMKANDFSPQQQAIFEGGPKASPTPFILSFLAELLMAFVLALLIRNSGVSGLGGALVLASTCWLGFVLTTTATSNAYGMRKMSLTIIDAGHWLGVLLVQALVLSLLG